MLYAIKSKISASGRFIPRRFILGIQIFDLLKSFWNNLITAYFHLIILTKTIRKNPENLGKKLGKRIRNSKISKI